MERISLGGTPVVGFGDTESLAREQANTGFYTGFTIGLLAGPAVGALAGRAITKKGFAGTAIGATVGVIAGPLVGSFIGRRI